jgi:hypothetical protein
MGGALVFFLIWLKNQRSAASRQLLRLGCVISWPELMARRRAIFIQSRKIKTWALQAISRTAIVGNTKWVADTRNVQNA